MEEEIGYILEESTGDRLELEGGLIISCRFRLNRTSQWVLKKDVFMRKHQSLYYENAKSVQERKYLPRELK